MGSDCPRPYVLGMNDSSDEHPLLEHLRREHETLRPHLDSILLAARAVGVVPVPVLRGMTAGVLGFLSRELEPHARVEDLVIYPAIDAALGADGATDTMRRDHTEVGRYIQRLSDLQGTLMLAHEPSAETLDELRHVLYGLHAIVELHFAKEEEVHGSVLSERLAPAEQRLLLDRLQEHANH